MYVKPHTSSNLDVFAEMHTTVLQLNLSGPEKHSCPKSPPPPPPKFPNSEKKEWCQYNLIWLDLKYK